MSERRRNGRSGHRRQRRRRRVGAPEVPLPTVEEEWFYDGNQRMLVAGHTSNGFPYGCVEDMESGYTEESPVSP
jgi:hypothetical protein